MKRAYLCIAVALIAFGAIVDLRNSNAYDDESGTSNDQKLELVDRLDLISRIEGLEKRLTVLEERNSLIRQADNREPSVMAQPEKFSPVPSATEAALPSPDPEADDADDVQHTNGQRWSFRLLRDRTSAQPSMLIPNHIKRVAPTRPTDRSPRA